MKILVTGAKGFVGKNLVHRLKNLGYADIFEYDKNNTEDDLEDFCKQCDFVYHLAGVNRPKNEEEFKKGNFDFTQKLLEILKKYDNSAPIMLSSSIQAKLDNPYGVSKKAGEDLLFEYADEVNTTVYVYRFPNIFGKWCKPNYNSAVATFCNNIANDLPITVNNRDTKLTLVYIDDVVNSLVALLDTEINNNRYFYVDRQYEATLGEIVDLLYSFKESRGKRAVANMSNEFESKLYSTYLSYLPKDKFSYPLKMNVDNRGSFTEIIRTADRGQFSVNISKPHIIKGNHWHDSKNEKFLVVSGKGVIRFRQIDSNEIIEYFVSGDNLQVVDIPTGYTHNIENLGDTDMVTFMWANESFNPEKPDTYFLEV